MHCMAALATSPGFFWSKTPDGSKFPHRVRSVPTSSLAFFRGTIQSISITSAPVRATGFRRQTSPRQRQASGTSCRGQARGGGTAAERRERGSPPRGRDGLPRLWIPFPTVLSGVASPRATRVRHPATPPSDPAPKGKGNTQNTVGRKRAPVCKRMGFCRVGLGLHRPRAVSFAGLR